MEIQTVEDLKQLVSKTEANFVTLGLTDFHGIVRGKMISVDKLISGLDGGVGFAPLVLALDPGDHILEAPDLSQGEDGFGDCMTRIVPGSVRTIPWESEKRNLFVLAEYEAPMDDLCPRGICRRIIERANGLGFDPYCGIELEFTLFDETSISAAQKGYKNLTPTNTDKTYYQLIRHTVRSEFYNDLIDACQALEIPLDSVHEEMGPGFLEAALKYGPALTSADNAAIFKTFTKAVAQRSGKLATFMARWSNDADGQSGHIHISLKDKDGKSAFYDEQGEDGMSDTARYFIGGLQRLLPQIALMCIPNVNSMKRIVPGIFAPIAVDWGIENRTCAVRAIPGSAKSSRIECRVPGADANSYLSSAATIAAGLYGIENKIEPTQPTSGNAYEQPVQEELKFARSFSEMIERFQNCTQARELFGSKFVDAFAETRKSQAQQMQDLVTDRELARFFELG